MAQYIVKAAKTYLKTPLTTTATSVVLRKLQDSKGNNLTLANFGAWGVIVVKQGDTIEMIKFSGISTAADDTATLTVASSGRNLNPTTPYAGSSTGNAFQSGAEVIVTNDPLTVMQFGNLNNAQTWAALQTFSVAPISSVDAVAASELVRKSQLDAAVLGSLTLTPVVVPAVAGETLAVDQVVYLNEADGEWYKADADTAGTVGNIILGITRGAGTNGNAITNGVTVWGAHEAASVIFTANTRYYASNTAGGFSSSAGTTEVTLGWANTTTKFYFLPRYNQQITENQQDLIEQFEAGTDWYAASSAGTDSYAITITPAITAYTTGMKFRFKADVANTGAATLAVSGLSALAIKKLNDQDLATGDIEAGQIVEVVYDGTDFQMQSQTATTPATQKFGGTGADGALSITSGTTTLDLGSASYFEKNYSSISITGTGKLAFSNPHANGTVIVLRSQGGVTLTSSQAPMIDAGAVGGAGGAAAAEGTQGFSQFAKCDNGDAGSNNSGTTGGAGGTGGTGGAMFIGTVGSAVHSRFVRLATGGGGGGGYGGFGTGGRGGGALLIECAGAFNFTTASGISVAGANGSNGITSAAGGGGGGAGGSCVILYNTLTANSGTITVSGGTGGVGKGNSGADASGGAGGNGTGGSGNGGNGGKGGDAGTTGGDGGGGGGAIDLDTANGTVGTGGTGGNGGGGGGGGGGASGYSLVLANTMFS